VQLLQHKIRSLPSAAGPSGKCRHPGRLTEFDQIAGAGAKIKMIDGLGDRAGMLNGVPENGLPPNAIMLYVVKGKSFITIGISGMADELPASEKTEAVAQKILAQL
jgi:hypothetical protein